MLRTAGTVLCSTLFAANAASATTLRAMSTEELVQASSAIGVVEVVDTASVRHGSRLMTLVTVEVLSPLKGLQRGQRLIIRIPGGAEGQWAQHVDGAPVMREGEMSMAFLENGGVSNYQVVGMEQGELDIVRDPDHPDRWLVQRTTTVPRMIRGPDGTWQEAPAEPQTEPLDAFMDRVRSAMEANP